jgi:hypothetical protein
MTKILTRFSLEEGAWAKLQYAAALMHKPPKEVAELIMLKTLGEIEMTKLVSELASFDNFLKAGKKGGRKK